MQQQLWLNVLFPHELRINPHDPNCLFCKFIICSMYVCMYVCMSVCRKKPTLVRSSIMFCCSRTWSLRKAISWSSWAWSRSFRDFSFFSGGWELIFSFCRHTTDNSSSTCQSACPSCKKSTTCIMMLKWLCADHFKVLLGQALEFLLQLLDGLGQIIIPLTQQLVLVQQGLTLLLRLSYSLQLVGRKGTQEYIKLRQKLGNLKERQKDEDKWQKEERLGEPSFSTKSFGRTSSFLSSTSSELRSSNLRIVELSSAMRLWFLLRSWEKQTSKKDKLFD